MHPRGILATFIRAPAGFPPSPSPCTPRHCDDLTVPFCKRWDVATDTVMPDTSNLAWLAIQTAEYDEIVVIVLSETVHDTWT